MAGPVREEGGDGLVSASTHDHGRRSGTPGAGCGPDCPGNRIPLTPYEAARIARGLEITTGELLRRYMVEGSGVLAVKENGTCVFHREADGCEVHGDRPLACRSFLDPEDTPGRFVERARQYREVLRAWRRASLARQTAEPGETPHPAPELGTWLLDVDSLVAERCAERGIPIPSDLEERIDIHLAALRAALE